MAKERSDKQILKEINKGRIISGPAQKTSLGLATMMFFVSMGKIVNRLSPENVKFWILLASGIISLMIVFYMVFTGKRLAFLLSGILLSISFFSGSVLTGADTYFPILLKYRNTMLIIMGISLLCFLITIYAAIFMHGSSEQKRNAIENLQTLAVLVIILIGILGILFLIFG